MSARDTVTKLIHEWKPDEQPTELKYRDSLLAFLRERLKDAKIEREYRHSGTTTDIYVRQSGFLGTSEVFVELKRNLVQKAQLNRLIGQIEDLQPKRNHIVVVLCGETDPALLSRLKEHYGMSELWTPMVTVVLKRTAQSNAT
jgi:hypothetical protein